MTSQIVREENLRFQCFSCCGDEDLFPFKCPACGWVMVFCYECGTLYPDLRDTRIQNHAINHFDHAKSAFCCPNCHHEIEYYFMKNPAYLVSRLEWIEAGYQALLE